MAAFGIANLTGAPLRPLHGPRQAGGAARRAGPPGPHSAGQRATAAAAIADDTVEGRAIQNLRSEYCDDFVCTSSPAVEQTVRSLARDLERCDGKWTRKLFARNVEYQDPLRRFKGQDGYARLDFVARNVADPRRTVSGMRMLGDGGAEAEIAWSLAGRLGPVPLNLPGMTSIKMNLVTGQIEQHRESWELGKAGPAAALAWLAARALWSSQQASRDAATAAGSVLDSLTSMDEPDAGYTADPRDPTKFFQQGRDTFRQDAVFFMAVVGLFYCLAKGWAYLDQL